MKAFISFTMMLLAASSICGQAVVSGTVNDHRNKAINGATIRVKGSGKAVMSDSAGHYSINVTDKEKAVLQVSSVGYADKEITVQLAGKGMVLNIILKEQPRQLKDVVVVSAGSFDASDKAKGASLTPMDAVTVAGTGGDIANALRSLPGAQQIGEREGLFIRGGTSDEAKQFIDGTLLKNPNYASVPGILQPARLNPFLFKGILFNTGGYSALYGQALSSALILESVDLPDESEAGLHLFPTSMGAGIQKLAANKKSSYGFHAQYGNTGWYNKVVKQNCGYFHDPLYISADANFRIKTSKTGILKFFTNYGYNHTGMRNPDIDSSQLLSAFENRGSNVYANLAYKEMLGNNWKIDAGLAYNYNDQSVANRLEDSAHQQLFLTSFPYNGKNSNTQLRSHFSQVRMVATKMLARSQALRIGAEHFYGNDSYLRNGSPAVIADHLTAAFAETDIHLSNNIAVKTGIRAEHSTLLNQWNLAPRISLAYRFRDGGQVNMAYGMFYQKPELDYLLRNTGLDYARATHYIVNYQKKANNRLLRVEAYYKHYNSLVTTLPAVGNAGSGFAKGIELFFRDKKTFKGFDYWITYTFLHTSRRFLNYPNAMQPDFATPHTMSVAVKRYFQDINFNVNLSYALATGRPYYHILTNQEGKPYVSQQGTTRMYNQMNLSFAYLFTLFKKAKHPAFAGIGWGVNNVLGSMQVFGYNFSYNGLNKQAVTLPATRSYYLGIFMSLGIDRRDDFINNNL